MNLIRKSRIAETLRLLSFLLILGAALCSADNALCAETMLFEESVLSELDKEPKLNWIRDPFLRSPGHQLKLNSPQTRTLEAILWDPSRPHVVIDGVVLGIGDRLGEDKVQTIRESYVVLENGIDLLELRIRPEEKMAKAEDASKKSEEGTIKIEEAIK